MTTLRDVAKKANVSQMTVSRVFNHPETVSDELKELVFSAVKELNYHPNASAKALKNKKTQVIKVLILENISSAEPYYMRVLAGITKKLDTLQYSLQLSSQFDLDIDTCDGLIVMGAKNTDHRKLAKLDKPLVLFGENPYFDFADTDNQKDIYQATIYAAHCGYEHLYYIGLDHLETFAKKRRSGYEQAISHLNKNSQIFTISGAHDGEPVTIETLVLFYNKDLIDHAPTTFQELEELSKDPKYAYENDKSKNVAFLTQWTNFYNAYGLIKGYGGYIFGDNGTDPKNIGLNNKGAVEGITYMTNWFKNTWPKGMQAKTSNQNFITDQFTKGKTAVIIDGPWQAAAYKKAGVNYGVAKLPTLANGEKYQAFGGGKAWVISQYSKNKGMAQKFIDYLTNDKNMQKFYDMTQEVPANEKTRTAVAKTNNELTSAVIEQYKDASPMPNIPEMTEVWTGAENMVINAASGKDTPKQAADKATKQIQQAIKQKYKE